MHEKKRILCIVGGMNAGGAETFLMKVYRELDKSKYQMDFYVTNPKEGFYDQEIISMGGKIFRSIPKSKNILKSYKNLAKVVKCNNYKYVLRISQHSLSALDLLIAKINGAKVLVYRSSNSKTGGGKFNTLLHILFKWLPKIIPTVKIAPSTKTAIFMFGKKSVVNNKVKIIKNGIPLLKFQYNENVRKEVRKELGIKDKFVVGHIGRFTEQKNHMFLLEVFSEIIKMHENSQLLLIGQGELEEEIRDKVRKLEIENRVIFAGTRSDIPKLLMAMDVFIFPSFYEGMPNSVIEAQATGLPCLISDTVTKEIQITDLVNFLSISVDAKEWAEKAIECNKYIRKDTTHILRMNGYDIKEVTEDFVKIVFNINK